MHILHVIDSLAAGGAERMLVDIANASAAAGQQVSVCVTRAAMTLASDLRPDIPVLVLDRRKRFEFGAMRRLAAYCHTAKVDILHVHGRTSLSFVALIKTLGMIRPPVLLHDHYGIEMNASIPNWFRWWGRFFVNRYVGVYPRLAEWAKSAGIPAQKVHWLGNALDFSRLTHPRNQILRSTYAVPDAVQIGVIIGGIRREKGIDLLLESMAQTHTQAPFRLFIIGKDTDPAYAATCRAQVLALGLGERVQFIGERTDAVLLAHGADFALMPSRSESGPLVLIEIMAAALPFVAFEVGSISQQAARSGVPGFVTPLDVVAFARAVDTLLMLSPAARRARGAAGEQIAQAHFKIEAKLPEWLAIYRKMLSNPTEQ